MAKRKPDHLKIVQGTFRKDRSNPDAPEPVDAPPIAPDDLSEKEQKYFDELVEVITGMGLATASDVRMIAIAAKYLAQIEACDLEIAENGYVVDSTNTRGERMLRGNPAVGQRSVALRYLQSILAEFGLSPAARTKVSAKKQKKTETPFTKRASK